MKLILLAFLIISSLSFAETNYPIDDFSQNIKKSHNIKILNHGIAALEERLVLIESAKESIDVEYYIFKQDFASQIIIQALKNKAQEGIQVRLLIDYFANRKSENPQILASLKDSGVKIKFFNTTPLINFYQVQYRNHRKALIIDNNKAVIGGRNIANEYFDLDNKFNFLDRDMTVEGPIVNTISKTFEANYNSKWASYLKRPKKPSINDQKYQSSEDFVSPAQQYENDLKQWNRNVSNADKFLNEKLDLEPIRSLGQRELSNAPVGTCGNLTFLSEVPSFGRRNKYERILKELIKNKIENTKDSMVIESPYFILTNEFKEVVGKALDSSVNIKLLTNSITSTDQIFVYSAFETELYENLHQYLDTYIANGKLESNYPILPQVSNAKFGIHSKTFVFDKKDFIISTFNFDPRSSDINSELLILCEDSPTLAIEILENIESRLVETTHIESSEDLWNASYGNGSVMEIILSLLSKIPSRIFKFLL